jgi:hypothetical protein
LRHTLTTAQRDEILSLAFYLLCSACAAPLGLGLRF